MSPHEFLVALTIVLGVAAVTTVVFQRLRQPVVLGYVMAGFIIGPNVPVPLVADPEVIQVLSELGVILLMFSLGLEFSLSALFKLGPTAGITALLQSSLMVWLGYVTGQVLGFTRIESLFAGAIIAISSTTIIAKAFDEQGIKGPMRELVVGVLIVEDLIAILLMATLTAIASGAGLSAAEMAATTGKLAAFLVGLVLAGLLVVPRAVRAIHRLGRPETTLVASIGFCFAVSLLAQEAGYSVALGAFVAGSLIAESGDQKPIERLIQPVRDMFAAIFFVSVGVVIDPKLIGAHWKAILVFTLVVVLGKVAGVSLGAFLTGNSVRTSVQAGMSLAQIGEFSFIIAGLGLSLRATSDFLYPIAVAVSAITTLTTPWMIRSADSAAKLIDRKMPRPLQTFAALYGSWVERLRRAPAAPTRGAEIRRLVGLLAIDVLAVAVIAVGAAASMDRSVTFAEAKLGVDATIAQTVLVVAAMVLALPPCVGFLRVARRLGLVLAEGALPAAATGAVDLAAAPRRALVVTLQLAIALLAGLPLLAITQPFVGGAYGPVLLVLLLATIGVSFWRGAADLHGHVRASAQAIVEALLAQARRDGTSSAPGHVEGPTPEDDLRQIHRILPGLGEPVPVRLPDHCAAAGRSLAELDLRGSTGATVLAITRGGEGILIPTAKEVLRPGDLLALAGTHESIEAARDLLTSAAPQEPAP
ncbi:MAG: cation:proton antiporter [Acidobacteriota bacterium]